jgi:heme exporter protein A
MAVRAPKPAASRRIVTGLLSARELRVVRGDRCLIDGLDFELDAGELMQVEGPNGSGKTSLLRAISGLVDPDEGEIRWRGEDVRRHRQAFHADLVWLGHRPGFKGDLGILENLRFESGLRAASTSAAGDVLERLGLARLLRIPFRLLSAGQQRRAALARLLLSAVPLWIVDEPFTNLDSEGRELVTELLDEHLAKGGLAVMASHQDVAMRAAARRIRLP